MGLVSLAFVLLLAAYEVGVRIAQTRRIYSNAHSSEHYRL
jgi:hypothetical protein